MTDFLPPEVILKAGRTQQFIWRDVWRHRELLFALVWRNVSVHYKQAVIGLTWTFLRPAILLTIYTIIFGYLAKLPAVDSVPYILFVLTGMLVWLFLSNAISAASNAFVADASLVSKVYLPRIILPLSHVLSTGLDFLVTLVMLGAIMLWYGFVPSVNLVAFPLLLVHLLILITGAGLLLASLNVRYRDIQQLTPFLLQLGFYASPVVYSSHAVPEKWRVLYFLNPAAGLIEAFRWSVLGLPVDPIYWLMSAGMTLVIFIVAVRYFLVVERSMVDVL